MDISINGDRTIASADPGTPLSQILSELRTYLGQAGMAIVGLMLDGEELDGARELRIGHTLVDDLDLLEVEMVPQTLLAQVTLQGIRDHLPKLSTTLVSVTECLQKGDTKSGLGLMEASFSGWKLLMEGVVNCAKTAGADLGGIKVGDEEMVEAIESLKANLQEALRALLDGDMVTVGDMMEYELAPAVDKWEEALGELAARIGESPDATA